MADLNDVWELVETQSELIDLLGAKAIAFDTCYKAFNEMWDKFTQEGAKIISDFTSGEGVSKELASEILIKTKLIREVVCFMEETLKKQEEGDDEC